MSQRQSPQLDPGIEQLCRMLEDAITTGNLLSAARAAILLAHRRDAVTLTSGHREPSPVSTHYSSSSTQTVEDGGQAVGEDRELRTHIYVEDKNGTRFGPLYFYLQATQKITDLHKLIEEKLGIPSDAQSWIINRRVASDNDFTIGDYGVHDDNTKLYCYTSTINFMPVKRSVTASSVDSVSPLSAVDDDDEEEVVIGWCCPLCTYINEPSRPGCEMCGTDQPQDYKPPPNYMPTSRELRRIRGEREQHAALNDLAAAEEDARLCNYMNLVNTDEQSVITNQERFDCPICFDDINIGDGVTLRECLHDFCKDCLKELVVTCTEAVVRCPFRDNKYACKEALLDREIAALVSSDQYETYLNRRLALGEAQATNSFHCKTPDCKGWCMYEDDVNAFVCEVCTHQNCLTCKVQHEGINCKQYQDQLMLSAKNDVNAKKTRDAIQTLLARGDAMRCPQCDIVLQKKEGCDWLKCTYCHTEICWATRGPRWGPKGNGDISGGCRCRVNGNRCHKKCRNCH